MKIQLLLCFLLVTTTLVEVQGDWIDVIRAVNNQKTNQIKEEGHRQKVRRCEERLLECERNCKKLDENCRNTCQNDFSLCSYSFF